jgi:hypothetical protein
VARCSCPRGRDDYRYAVTEQGQRPWLEPAESRTEKHCTDEAGDTRRQVKSGAAAVVLLITTDKTTAHDNDGRETD